MHIAYLVSLDPYRSATGTEVGARNVAEAMSARGHEVTIFHAYSTRSEAMNRSGVRTVGVRHTTIRFVAGAEANRKVLRAIQNDNGGRFDVIDLFGCGLGPAFSRAATIRTARIYHAIDVAKLEWGAVERGKLASAPFYLSLMLAERTAVLAADHIIAISRATAEGLAKAHPRGLGETHVVPLPLRDEWFSSPENLRREHFLYIAAGRRRWTRVFLEALARVRRDGVVAKGVVLREPRDEFRKQARTLGVDVDFLNFIPESTLREYYARAYALVLPSSREGMCVPIIEAASQGTPTIASPLPSVAEFVDDNETGVLVRSADPREWAEKMLLVMSDESLRRRLGSRARDKSESYRASTVALTTENIYGRQSR